MFFKVFNSVRNHPKKTVVFGAIIGLGANFFKQKYNEECLMRAYCEEASKYGEVSHHLTSEDRHITVILNPAANSNKGKTKYEKYCAPLLHLAGLKVALVRTEHEDQAKQIMDVMDNTSAVVVAGGDGTLLEILTGLLRRDDARTASRRFPLGILPLGETNTAASSIFGFNKTPEVQHLAEATMAVVKNLRRSLDVMEITPIDDDSGTPKKPVYAASLLEWGAFTDAAERKSLYWYWAFLKKYMVYVFSSYKDLSWNCAASIEYSLPCKGCSRCIEKREEEEREAQPEIARRWWQAFVPRSRNRNVEEREEIDYSSILNEKCGEKYQLEIEDISDVRILSKNTPWSTNIEGHSVNLQLGKESIKSSEFIKEGWRRESGEVPYEQSFIVGELSIAPKDEVKKDKKGEDRKLKIDSESFEVRTMKIRPKPKAVTVFAPPLTHNVCLHPEVGT